MSGAALMDALIGAHNDRDLEALAACYATDASVFMDGWDQPIDVASWAAVFDALRESYPDLRLESGPVTLGDATVAAEIRLTGTNTGPLNLSVVDRLILNTDAERLPPTGRPLQLVGFVVIEHADQRVTAERHYWPAVGWLTQLGLVSLGEPVGVAR
jgi:hypothetical protein